MAGGTPVIAARTDGSVSIMIGVLAIAILGVAIAWIIRDLGLAPRLAFDVPLAWS